MENLKQNEQMIIEETKSSALHTVTPLSKYLAMGLFVTLPFVGGWIGYSYAPEKVVEVERVVVLEKEVPTNTELESTNLQNETTEPISDSEEKSLQEILGEYFPTLANVNAGDTIGAFTVDTIEVKMGSATISRENEKMGSATISRSPHSFQDLLDAVFLNSFVNPAVFSKRNTFLL